MHTNERFLTQCSPEQILDLIIQAGDMGKKYLSALTEQLERLNIPNPKV